MEEYRNAAEPANSDGDPVAFLEAISGGLPLSVASIRPDVPGISGATFSLPADRDRLAVWVAEREGQENLYYSLNAAAAGAPRKGRGGKLAEADVAHIRGVAVDLDPRKGVPLEEERQRLRHIAERQLARNDGAPSYIVDSGGGVQMVWLLDAPLPCTPETAAAVKAQAKGIGEALGSDPVHSLDHLFRIPGTTNIPDARKRERGRTECPAQLLHTGDARYALDGLEHVAPPASAPEGAPSHTCPDLNYGAVLDALGEPGSLPAHLRAIADDCRDRYGQIVGDAAGDRSASDYRLGAYLIREHRITDPTTLAQVVFAVSGERLGEEEDRGRGEYYCRQTISKALERNRPDLRPEDFFEPVDLAALTSDPALKAMFRQSVEGDVFECLDIDAIEALPDPVFMVDRHIPDASLGFLYGDPGCGKSFVALDLALHLAYGLPDWHGDRITSGGKGAVVYIAQEGAAGLKKRIAGWKRARLLPDGSKPRFHLIRQSLSFMRSDDIAKLIRTVRASVWGPVSLVVVDTVSRAMPGADENLQKDMTLFVRACEALQAEFQSAVLGVHHTSKSGEMRGSSVLKGAGDFVFRLTRKPDSDFADLHCEKQKDAPDGWSEGYRLALTAWESGGHQLSTRVAHRVERAALTEAEQAQAQRIARIAHEALAGATSARLSECRTAITAALRAQGITSASARDKIDTILKENLCRGVQFEASGQIVKLTLEQHGPGPTSPWVISVHEFPRMEVFG